MSGTDLGPSWEPEPDTQTTGFLRYWLRSRRFGITQNDEGGWSVIDREGRETHGDVIWKRDEARALAERCDAVPEQPAPVSPPG